MIGTNANNGKPLGGMDHLRQSIRDILSTPRGSRVMRRDYGSDLPALVDAPLTRSTVMDIYAAIGHALAKWEPRIQLQAVSVEAPTPGELVVSLTALVNGQLQRLNSITLTLRPAPMLWPARMLVS